MAASSLLLACPAFWLPTPSLHLPAAPARLPAAPLMQLGSIEPPQGAKDFKNKKKQQRSANGGSPTAAAEIVATAADIQPGADLSGPDYVGSRYAPRFSGADESYTLTLEAPGLPASSLVIEALDGKMTIKGETKTRTINYELNIPADADVASAYASALDGLLTITMAKIPQLDPLFRIHVSEEEWEAPDGEEAPKVKPLELSMVATGVAPADMTVRVDVEGKKLLVHGETPRTGAKILKEIRLPRDVDVAHARASHVDGVLSVTIPMKPPPEARLIVVKVKAAKRTAVSPMPEEAAPSVKHSKVRRAAKEMVLSHAHADHAAAAMA